MLTIKYVPSRTSPASISLQVINSFSERDVICDLLLAVPAAAAAADTG